MLTEILDWIAAQPLVAFIRIDRFAYATINAMHILGISLLVGAIICSDLRTTGFWKAGRWREGLETCVPVAASGLALAIATGALLFSVRGGHYVSNPAFLVKALLIVIGLANVFIFRRAKARQSGASPSVTMKLSAMCSIAIWVSAVFAGRWIAFSS